MAIGHVRGNFLEFYEEAFGRVARWSALPRPRSFPKACQWRFQLAEGDVGVIPWPFTSPRSFPPRIA